MHFPNHVSTSPAPSSQLWNSLLCSLQRCSLSLRGQVMLMVHLRRGIPSSVILNTQSSAESLYCCWLQQRQATGAMVEGRLHPNIEESWGMCASHSILNLLMYLVCIFFAWMVFLVPRIWVTNGCEPPYACWEWMILECSGSAQAVLVAAKTSFQTWESYFFLGNPSGPLLGFCRCHHTMSKYGKQGFWCYNLSCQTGKEKPYCKMELPCLGFWGLV